MKECNKWRVTVGKKHIGIFDSPEYAAHIYDAIALKEYGEFAVLNFPNDVIKFTPSVLVSSNTSGYRGVHKSSKYKWTVAFHDGNKRYRLFGFSNSQDAARAYDELAKQHLGDKAKLNFPKHS